MLNRCAAMTDKNAVTIKPNNTWDAGEELKHTKQILKNVRFR